MSDEQARVLSVRERMQRAGMSDDRIAEHFAAGVVQLDGETVADLDLPAPDGSRVVLARR